MTIRAEHELHQRRRGRNVGLGLSLAFFVLLILALTMVKVARGDFEMISQQAQNTAEETN